MGSGPIEKAPSTNVRDAATSTGVWLTPGRFALLLGILIVACFPQVIAGSETFYAVDFGSFGYPMAAYFRDCFWAGQVPLWNPYNNCGTPFLAQWNTMTLYPFSLFYLMFPLSWALGVFCLLHLFLGGLGMYFLARRWTGNPFAAAVGGMAFAFNGLTWFGLMWPNNIAALGWMPWVVLVMEKCWTTSNAGLQKASVSKGCFGSFHCLSQGRSVALAGLIGAIQMLSGAPEVIMLTWLFIIALWVTQFFLASAPRNQMLKRALAVGALVSGLSAAQIMPFLDLLSHSQRNAQFDNSAMLSMPAYGWANYLVPLFHCFYSLQGVLIQPNQGWTGSYYVGVVVLALAFFAIWNARNRYVWLLMATLLFSLTMALGNHLFVYALVKHVMPFIGFMRFPVKFVILTTFVLPLLAAFGLNRLVTQTNEQWPLKWKRLRIIAFGLLAVIVLILGFAWRSPLGTDNVPATMVNGISRAVFLGLALACIALFHNFENEVSRSRIWQTGLILLLWFDVFTHAPNLSPTVTRSVYDPDSIRQFFNWGSQLRPEVSRAMQSKSAFWKMLSARTGNPETDINGLRLSLSLNFNILDHAAKVDGFYSLDLKEFGRVSGLVLFSTNDTSKLQDFLMVSLVSNPTNDVDWIARDSALPLVTAGQKPVFTTREDELNSLIGGRFNPRQMVCLPDELREKVHANATNAKIGGLQYTPQKIQFEVEAGAPAMVVISQAFYHPWHAYVDGTRVPLWRANHAFQALEVPAGKHEVSVVYEDRLFLAGAILSVASLLICAVVWIGSNPKRTEKADA